MVGTSIKFCPAVLLIARADVRTLSRKYGIIQSIAERIDLRPIFFSHKIELKRRRQHRSKAGPAAGNSAPSSSQPAPLVPAPKLSPLKLWCFRFGALLLVPLLLGGVELGLRLAGYGYPTAFFKRIQIGNEECLVENDKFGLRFFPPALARSPAPVVMKAK